MDIELSRRAAQVMNTKPILDLTASKKRKFIKDVASAKDFDDLSLVHKKLIKKGERELKAVRS